MQGQQWWTGNRSHEITAMQATRMPSSKPPSRMSRLFASVPATCIEDLRVLAERRVPRMFYDYADSGSYTEGTYRANEADFAKINLVSADILVKTPYGLNAGTHLQPETVRAHAV